MTPTRLIIPLVVLAAPWICGTLAAEEKLSLPRLVSFAELERSLGDPNLRVLDARSKADYDKGHIPGAVWVDAKAVAALAAKNPRVLTDPKAWESWLAPLGIAPNTEVFLYDANRQLDAARLWWVLKYLGVERVGLVNGGFPLWSAENRPVTTKVPTVAPSSFKVAFRNDWNATRAEVLAALQAKSARIVDARSRGEYEGSEKRAKRGGHIPAACHLEWSDLVSKDGRFLDEAELRGKLAKAGVKASEPVITHCQSGGRASVNAFVLERLGIKTRNYYLGWSDWGNAEETPVDAEAPAKPGP